jgi:hypothetical protein
MLSAEVFILFSCLENGTQKIKIDPSLSAHNQYENKEASISLTCFCALFRILLDKLELHLTIFFLWSFTLKNS